MAPQRRGPWKFVLYGKMRSEKLHKTLGLQMKMFKIEFFSYYETVFGRYTRVGVKKAPFGGYIEHHGISRSDFWNLHEKLSIWVYLA